MTDMPTNALIACIGAVRLELDRLNAVIADESLYTDAEAVELGEYNLDLSAASSDLIEEYERLREENPSLRPIEEHVEAIRMRSAGLSSRAAPALRRAS